MLGKNPQELNYEKPEDSITYLLDHFYQAKRAAGEKISYTELKHYSELMHFNLSGFEVEVIMQIDSIFEGSVHG